MLVSAIHFTEINKKLFHLRVAWILHFCVNLRFWWWRVVVAHTGDWLWSLFSVDREHIVLHTWLHICRRLPAFPVCWQGEEMVVSWCRLFGTPTLWPVSDILCYIKLGFQSGVGNAIHICKGNAFSLQMCHLKGRHSNGISFVFLFFY